MSRKKEVFALLEIFVKITSNHIIKNMLFRVHFKVNITRRRAMREYFKENWKPLGVTFIATIIAFFFICNYV